MTKRPSVIDTEVVIVGGGLVGGTLACLLAGVGVPSVLVDRAPVEAGLDPAFDGRASSIAVSSHRALRSAGLWPALEAVVNPIEDIRVSDGASPLFLHYDHRDVGDEPFGYMIENRHIRHAIAERFGGIADLTVLAPVSIASVERDQTGVALTLADGRTVRARLLVGADGRGSAIREGAGLRVTRWDYDQAGIVCSVRHEKPHSNIAHERFLPSGPFAILPLQNNRASIVWTEKKHLAPTIMALDDRDFAGELRRRFGDFLGEVEPEPKRWSYPLSLQFAERHTDRRLALAGDAAHAMHPIAGQGLNMGLRDAAALAEAVIDARRLGLDIGGGTVLDRYARWRGFDNTLMLGMTDMLNRLFSNDIGPVRAARDIGLAMVNRAGPLKKVFMRHAMGLVGELPRVLRGEPL
ncbi:MAG: UbiH/UbiF/VisC/COQ6 family ubiquinone biosynthesis hydroxylase [Rhodospirillales bacterium]